MTSIRISGDVRVQCPILSCSVGMTLTQQGAEMLLAQQTRCRRHDVVMVVVTR